jgi:MAP3K TRAFs-binding domain
MSQVPSEEARGICFVVMGFGKKTDFETGRTLDLDKTYRNIIKPAAEAARLKCVRADEIVHSGLIDVPMYEQLLNADVVIADLSTSNKNAFYELGVRHALRPYTTIVIAEDGIKTFPFDVNHVVVRQYHHLGEDIGYDEAVSFRTKLTEAIETILKDNPPTNDSPIYTFIHGLNPPSFALRAEVVAPVSTGEGAQQSGGATPEAGTVQGALTHHVLMEQVDEAESRGDFLSAKALLETVRRLMKSGDESRPDDPTILHRLARATYQSKHPTFVKALEEASAILIPLEPHTSNDTETLGLWGAIHKRLWDETRDRTHLNEAVRGYARGFFIRNDYYNGINLAYLLNVRSANAATRAEAIADFIQAQRTRKEVLSICESKLEHEQLNDSGKYWVLATMAEAYLGLGMDDLAEQKLREAFGISTPSWMKKTTEDQLNRLRSLLSKSPLKYVREEGE